MAGKKGSLEDFMSGLGKDSAVFKRLQARQTGRNPPKSMSGSTSVPAPKAKIAAPKAPAVAALTSKRYTAPTKQPELSKVISRPLEAQRSSRFTMAGAAARRLGNVRSNRGK